MKRRGFLWAGLALVPLLAGGVVAMRQQRSESETRAVLRQARTLLQEGKTEQARDVLARALAARDDPLLHLEYGRALYRLRRHDEAIVALRAAVRGAPDSADAQYGLGTALAAAGQSGAAVDPLRAAVRLAPGNAEAWRLLGVLPAGTPGLTPEQRLDALRRAWELEPDAPRYARTYAEALLRAGHNALAEEPARRLVAAQPAKGRNLLLLAKVQSNLAATDERAARLENTLRRLLEQAPRLAEAHYLLGLLRLHTGRFAEARAHLERAARLDPQHEAALYNLGRLCLRLGDRKGARHYLGRFARLDADRTRETIASRPPRVEIP